MNTNSLNKQEKIKEERKKPTCSMCRNHNVFKPSAGHKNLCAFDNPEHRMTCSKCTLTYERRVSWAKKIDKRRKIHKILEITIEALPGRQRGQQLCSKCLTHGITAINKNHKKLCPYKLCKCDKCIEVVDSCKAFNKEAGKIRETTPKSLPQRNKPVADIPISEMPIMDENCIDPENEQVNQIYLDLLTSVESNQLASIDIQGPKVEIIDDTNMEEFYNDIMDIMDLNQKEVNYENSFEKLEFCGPEASSYSEPRILSDENLENSIGMDFISDVESDLNEFLFFDFFDGRKSELKSSDVSFSQF